VILILSKFGQIIRCLFKVSFWTHWKGGGMLYPNIFYMFIFMTSSFCSILIFVLFDFRFMCLSEVNRLSPYFVFLFLYCFIYVRFCFFQSFLRTQLTTRHLILKQTSCFLIKIILLELFFPSLFFINIETFQFSKTIFFRFSDFIELSILIFLY
jgi:hypothetical protein